MENSQNQKKYWKENIRLLLILLSIWFLVSFGAGILWVEELNAIRLGGFKLGFWFAQQGSIYVFVILIFIYVKLMNKLDKKYKFKRRPKQSNLITIVRKKYYDNEIDCNKLIFLVEKLRAKNSRSLSGILEVAIMTKPGEFSCEFDCYYCPNQKGYARSYLAKEPAVPSLLFSIITSQSIKLNFLL